MKKFMLLLFSLLVVALLLPGCAAESAVVEDTPAEEVSVEEETAAEEAAAEDTAVEQEEVNLRITLWSSNEAHLAMFNAMAEEYKKDHPNVSVSFEPIPFGDYVSKVTVQLAGSNPPDAGWIVDSTAPTFIDAGVMVDLKPYLEAYEGYDLADFGEGPMSLWVDGDAIYGVPFSTSPYVIFYNKDLFAAAGVSTPDVLIEEGRWTWDELRAAAKAIAEATDDTTYGFESYDGQIYGDRLWTTMGPIMKSFGGKPWNDEGTECTINQPEAVAAFELIHAMTFEDGSHVPPGETGDFFTGFSGMTLAQISRTAKLAEAPFEWDIAPLPAGPAGDQRAIGQAAFVVFKSSEHVDVAADFIAFVTNKQNVKTMAEFFPPARNSVLASDEFLTSNPLLSPESMEAAVGSSIPIGTVEGVHVNFPKIELAGRSMIDGLWRPDADVQAVLDATCEAIDPFMNP